MCHHSCRRLLSLLDERGNLTDLSVLHQPEAFLDSIDTTRIHPALRGEVVRLEAAENSSAVFDNVDAEVDPIRLVAVVDCLCDLERVVNRVVVIVCRPCFDGAPDPHHPLVAVSAHVVGLADHEAPSDKM